MNCKADLMRWEGGWVQDYPSRVQTDKDTVPLNQWHVRSSQNPAWSGGEVVVVIDNNKTIHVKKIFVAVKGSECRFLFISSYVQFSYTR